MNKDVFAMKWPSLQQKNGKIMCLLRKKLVGSTPGSKSTFVRKIKLEIQSELNFAANKKKSKIQTFCFSLFLLVFITSSDDEICYWTSLVF